MARTYTQHKLSDRSLVILSQLVNDRPAHYHGVALESLKRKGLAVEIAARSAYPKTAAITDAGRVALDQSRKEGW